MRLNGWQRLWVLGATIWASLVLLVAVTQFPEPGQLPVDPTSLASPSSYSYRVGEWVGMVLSIWALPAGALYALGVGIAWVRRGFASGE